jgi:hypothetical protein
MENRLVEALQEAVNVELGLKAVQAADDLEEWVQFNPTCHCRYCSNVVRAILLTAQGGRMDLPTEHDGFHGPFRG